MGASTNTPWLTACAELMTAIDLLHDFRRMSDQEFAVAVAAAAAHLRGADTALQQLIDEAGSADARTLCERCAAQLRAWMAPIEAGDRAQFRLVAIRDAVRLWLPDRRRLERERCAQAA